MINWTLHPANPVIRPGQIHGRLDARFAGAACVVAQGDEYRLFYWGRDDGGRYLILQARGRAGAYADASRDWTPMGVAIEPQPDTDYNCTGPSFPYVVAVDERHWLMYFCAWGRPRTDKTLPNSTGLAISEDGGITWRYHGRQPILALDRPYDAQATGSVSVLHEAGKFRMYYTSIGHYFAKPEGVRTGHGDRIPRIGVAYAESGDGIRWTKPLADWMVKSRLFDTEPYEYIASKPWVIRDGSGYRMWVSTFGHAYRIRSLTSPDGLHWTWEPSGPDGDLGVGTAGAFDDHQRSYAAVVKQGDIYRLWYTGNGFGATGIGYAEGHVAS